MIWYDMIWYDLWYDVWYASYSKLSKELKNGIDVFNAIGIEILVGQVFWRYRSKQSKYCYDQ